MTDRQLGTLIHQYCDKLQMKLSESNAQLLEHLDDSHFKDIKIHERTLKKCKHLFPVNQVITQMRRDANKLIGEEIINDSDVEETTP